MTNNEYKKWILMKEKFTPYKELEYNPLISIVMPVYNVDGYLLEECIKSILNQTYQNFEICIADDCSTKQSTKDMLKKYENHDKIKIVYRKENGHISLATNSALELAKGEYIALIDNDDIIVKEALYEMVYELNQDKNIDLVYSDEDKLDLKGRRCDPHFKPDFSIDSFYGGNFICHFTMIRKTIIDKIGGFRKGYEGAQDFDLFLRVSNETKNIKHVPKILYHWRMIPTSTAYSSDSKNYAGEAGKRALEDYLKVNNIDASVSIAVNTHYIVEYNLKTTPLVSIIIPTRDYAKILDRCLNSIYEKTTYKNYEIIIVDNGSKEQETFNVFNKYTSKYDNIKVIKKDCEFNYSYLNNEAVKEANGEYIILLNNDTEIITNDWIQVMLGYAMQKHIGCVGCKLLYFDNTVQHGGVALEPKKVAFHTFVGNQDKDYGIYGRLLVPYNYSAVTAACLMISKEKYNEVNGLETKLKVALNDVDLCLKMLDKGYNNIFLPQVKLYHYESKSRGKIDNNNDKYKRCQDEIRYMQEKWGNVLNSDKFYPKHLIERNKD